MFDRFPSERFFTIDNLDFQLEFLKDRNVKITHSGPNVQPKILNGENVILTTQGIRILAGYYEKKYNIKIQVVIVTNETYAEKFIESIDAALKTPLGRSESTKDGFIFFNAESGRHGHANSVVLERTLTQNRVYFFGGITHPEYKNYKTSLESEKKAAKPRSWDHKQEIQIRFPELEMWAFEDVRQLDLSSCTVIALSGLKDCLKMKESLDEVINQRGKYIETLFGVHFAYLPEELLKAAQIESEVKRAKSKPERIIHEHKVKNFNGNPTGEVKPISLRDFREHYAVITTYKKGIFGSYTLHKGRRYAELLERFWKQNRDYYVHHTLDILSEAKADFERVGSYHKGASLTEGSLFLDPLRENIPDDILVKNIIEIICGVILLIQKPPFDYKVDFNYQEKAKTVEQLLIILIADKTQPAIRKNFKTIEDQKKNRMFLLNEYLFLKKIREQAEKLAQSELTQNKSPSKG